MLFRCLVFLFVWLVACGQPKIREVGDTAGFPAVNTTATDTDGDDRDDDDGDGYVDGDDVDCDDSDPDIHPGAREDCDDGRDNDCDGNVDDRDNDCGEGDDGDDDRDDDGDGADRDCDEVVMTTVRVEVEEDWCDGEFALRVDTDSDGVFEANVCEGMNDCEGSIHLPEAYFRLQGFCLEEPAWLLENEWEGGRNVLTSKMEELEFDGDAVDVNDGHDGEDATPGRGECTVYPGATHWVCNW